MPEFAGVALHRLITEHSRWPELLILACDDALTAGKGIAVYEAQCGDRLVYHFATFGPKGMPVEIVADDPIQLPYRKTMLLGDYELLGYYQGEPGSIEAGQDRPIFDADYVAARKAEIASQA